MAPEPTLLVNAVPVDIETAVLPVPVTTPSKMMPFAELCKDTVLLLEVAPLAPTVSVPPVLPTSTKPPVALAVTVTLPVLDSHMPPALNVPLVALIVVAAVLIGSMPVTVPPMAVPAVKVNVLAVTVNGPEPVGLIILLLGAFRVRSTLEVPKLLSTMNVLLAKVSSVTRILLFGPAALVPWVTRLIRLVFSVLSSTKLMLPAGPLPLEVRFNRVPVEALPAVVVVYTGAAMPIPPAALSVTLPVALVILALLRPPPSPLIFPVPAVVVISVTPVPLTPAFIFSAPPAVLMSTKPLPPFTSPIMFKPVELPPLLSVKPEPVVNVPSLATVLPVWPRMAEPVALVLPVRMSAVTPPPEPSVMLPTEFRVTVLPVAAPPLTAAPRAMALPAVVVARVTPVPVMPALTLSGPPAVLMEASPVPLLTMPVTLRPVVLMSSFRVKPAPAVNPARLATLLPDWPRIAVAVAPVALPLRVFAVITPPTAWVMLPAELRVTVLPTALPPLTDAPRAMALPAVVVARVTPVPVMTELTLSGPPAVLMEASPVPLSTMPVTFRPVVLPPFSRVKPAPALKSARLATLLPVWPRITVAAAPNVVPVSVPAVMVPALWLMLPAEARVTVRLPPLTAAPRAMALPGVVVARVTPKPVMPALTLSGPPAVLMEASPLPLLTRPVTFRPVVLPPSFRVKPAPAVKVPRLATLLLPWPRIAVAVAPVVLPVSVPAVMVPALWLMLPFEVRVTVPLPPLTAAPRAMALPALVVTRVTPVPVMPALTLSGPPAVLMEVSPVPLLTRPVTFRPVVLLPSFRVKPAPAVNVPRLATLLPLWPKIAVEDAPLVLPVRVLAVIRPLAVWLMPPFEVSVTVSPTAVPPFTAAPRAMALPAVVVARVTPVPVMSALTLSGPPAVLMETSPVPLLTRPVTFRPVVLLPSFRVKPAPAVNPPRLATLLPVWPRIAVAVAPVVLPVRVFALIRPLAAWVMLAAELRVTVLPTALPPLTLPLTAMLLLVPLVDRVTPVPVTLPLLLPSTTKLPVLVIEAKPVPALTGPVTVSPEFVPPL